MIRMLLLVLLAGPAFAQQKLPEGVKVQKNLAYGDHERNKLDLYVPKSDKPLPLIIWVHGGAWKAGSKDGNNPAMRFLEKGFAVAAINYRLSQQAQYPAQIEDCLAAVRYLRSIAKEHNLNTEKFAAWGASAGGHLVALMGTAAEEKTFLNYGKVKDGSAKVQCVIDFFGPIDFLTMNAMTTIKGPIDHDAKDSPESVLIGGAVQENKEKADKANPVKYISKTSAAFLICHGGKDPLVPVGQSEMFHEALKKANIESTLLITPDAGHDGRVGQGENASKIAAFLEKHLK